MEREYKFFFKNKNQKALAKSQAFYYNFLKKYYNKNRKKIKLILKQFEQAWKLIEKEYFKRLVKITKKPIPSKRFIVYLTLSKRCPYHPKDSSFGVSFFILLLMHAWLLLMKLCICNFINTFGKIARKR